MEKTKEVELKIVIRIEYDTDSVGFKDLHHDFQEVTHSCSDEDDLIRHIAEAALMSGYRNWLEGIKSVKKSYSGSGLSIWSEISLDDK
jgi:hypothetical protein